MHTDEHRFEQEDAEWSERLIPWFGLDLRHFRIAGQWKAGEENYIVRNVECFDLIDIKGVSD